MIQKLQDLFACKGRVAVAGHRGMGAVYPENTMLSYRKAAELGVDMIEIDIHLTSDGHCVLMHDYTVDRTTDGTGEIVKMTLEEFKALDAGIGFAPEFAGEHPPTLIEFCEWAQAYPEMLYNVEIKSKTLETVDKTVEILRRYGMVEKCVFACFDANIVAYFHDRYGLPTQGFPAERMQNFSNGENGTYSKMYAAGISMKDLTAERVQAFHEIGILPWCYCPDDDEGVHVSIESGAMLYTCNDPRPALRILAEKGLR